MKVIFHKGIKYRSVQELCDTYDISASLFRYYNTVKGMSVEDSIERCLHPVHNGNIITYNGITYSSELEMCNKLGVNYNNYAKRKSYGKPLEECLFPNKGKRAYRGKEVCYQGKVYRSVKELCDTYGIKVSMFWYYNSTKGMSVEDSMERCLHPKPMCTGCDSITYNSITYSSESEMCRRLGVDYSSYLGRKRRGKTVEECLSLDKDKRDRKGNEVCYQGKVYRSEKALCEAHGVSYKRYTRRKSRGKTVEECLSSDKYMSRGRAGNEVCYQGKVYANEKALCKALGMNYSTYRTRRRKGCTVEESLKPVN